MRRHGVEVSDVIRSEEASYVSFRDPDGNPVYVGDQDLVSDGASEFNDELQPHDGVASATT
jgi:hypothetical protein